METKIILKNRVEEISKLENFIEEVVTEMQLPEDWSFNLNLALEEAVANVINYAFPNEEEHSFEVTAASLPGGLSLTIVDDGKPFDPTSMPEVDTGLSAEERSIGGLGIHLIRKLMDEVRYERLEGKNRLTLIKRA